MRGIYDADARNEARVWTPSGRAPVAVRRFETVEQMLAWIDEAEVSPFSDEPLADGLAIDCLPYYRSFGVEAPDGTRSMFGSLGELVGRCIEEGLRFRGCDLAPSELRSLADFVGKVDSAAEDDPEAGRLVLYVEAAR